LLERVMAIEDVVYNVDGSVAAYRMSDGRMRVKLPTMTPAAPAAPMEHSALPDGAGEVPAGAHARRDRFLVYAIILLGSAALGLLGDVPGGYILPRGIMGFFAVVGITSVVVDIQLRASKRKPRSPS
jgi:hypothetical protein